MRLDFEIDWRGDEFLTNKQQPHARYVRQTSLPELCDKFYTHKQVGCGN